MRKVLFPMIALMLAAAWMAAPTQAEEKKAAAKIGQAAPSFTLTDQNGKEVSLSDFSGKVVVLEWFNPGCPFVKKHYNEGHMNQLVSRYTDKGVVWLAINSTDGNTKDSNAKSAEQWKISRPILNDAETQVAQLYGAKTTPHMYVIDKSGKLVYVGAIDNDTSNDSSKVAGAKNYVAQALDQVLAGQSVSEPETKPYGCAVKYRAN
jgi:peroxiredoxin